MANIIYIWPPTYDGELLRECGLEVPLGGRHRVLRYLDGHLGDVLGEHLPADTPQLKLGQAVPRGDAGVQFNKQLGYFGKGRV